MKFLAPYFKKISALFKRRPHSLFRRDPYKDWLRILIGAVIMFFVVALIDGFLFYKINRGEIFIEHNKTQLKVETLDRSGLKKVNDFYDSQQTKFSEIKASPSAVIDPSL